jgi:hypothetical protein
MILFAFLISYAIAVGAKTVWVSPYTRSDGTMVQGHWRSKPSSIQPLPSTVSEYYIPNVTSTIVVSPAQASKKSYYEHFERGFVGGQPYVKLVVQEKYPTSITEPAHSHHLEFSCVKTTDTVIESIDYVTTTMETVGGKVVNVDRRYSLKEANLWIGGKVFRGATMQNMFYIYGRTLNIHEIDGSLNELTFSMKGFWEPSKADDFLDQCKHLWTL